MDDERVQVRRTYHEEMNELRQQLLLMADMSVNMLLDAVRAVNSGNKGLAESVVRYDETVDALDLNIEARCVRLIALQQPVGQELRLVVATLKVVTDVERIADHAADIARMVGDIATVGVLKSPVDLMPIAETARIMVERAVASVFEPSEDLMETTARDIVDVRRQLFALQRDLYDRASTGEIAPTAAFGLELAAVYLERVAAHATNIAERAYYVSTGDFCPIGQWTEQVPG